MRPPSRRAVRPAIADAALVSGRNLRHFIRQPQLLLFSTIQPIMLGLLFVYVFGSAVSGSLPHGVDYVDFLLPGIFVQSVTFRATQTAIGLAEDLERGVVDRFRSMPMARSAVLLGQPCRCPYRGREGVEVVCARVASSVDEEAGCAGDSTCGRRRSAPATGQPPIPACEGSSGR